MSVSKVKQNLEEVELSPHKPRRQIGGVEVPLHCFLTSALGGGEWSTLYVYTGRFTLWKEFRYPLNRRLIVPQSWYGRF